MTCLRSLGSHYLSQDLNQSPVDFTVQYGDRFSLTDGVAQNSGFAGAEKCKGSKVGADCFEGPPGCRKWGQLVG